MKMMPSLPCGVCGAIDDLETIIPTGIHAERAVSWQCLCGNTRTVLIDHHVPSDLVRRAMVKDEMRRRVGRYLRAVFAAALILTPQVVPPDRDLSEVQVQPDASDVNWYKSPPRPSTGEINWMRRMIIEAQR